MASSLYGFGEVPYTIKQKYFEDELTKYLEANGLYRISMEEANEVVEGIGMLENNLFGTQMTVGTDVYKRQEEACGFSQRGESRFAGKCDSGEAERSRREARAERCYPDQK